MKKSKNSTRRALYNFTTTLMRGKNAMDKLIQQQLNSIEQAARQIVAGIRGIFGYCNGMETVVKHYSPTPILQFNQDSNGYQEIILSKTLIDEVKEMMIELKIKGSVRERANGLIELRTQALGSIYGRSKEDIEDKLTKKLKETKECKKTTTKTKAPLLSEFFISEYLPYKRNQQRAERSIENMKSLFQYVVKGNFDKPITSYKPKAIEDFLYSIQYGRTRQMVQGLFNNMFKRAIVLGLVKSNPCAAMEKVQHTQKQGTALSFDEQIKFFNNLFTADQLTYEEKCYFLFVYLTGARKNEALTVCVEDVDFKNKTLLLRGTKTEGSYREIPLTPLVEKLLCTLNVNSGEYFPFKEYHIEHIYKHVRDHHKLHDLRHTYGTIQICVEKMDIKTVSLIMGHSTVNTTLAIYTHPEQLDKGTFLRGNLTADEKLNTYKSKYAEISCSIRRFLDEHTQ